MNTIISALLICVVVCVLVSGQPPAPPCDGLTAGDACTVGQATGVCEEPDCSLFCNTGAAEKAAKAKGGKAKGKWSGKAK